MSRVWGAGALIVSMSLAAGSMAVAQDDEMKKKIESLEAGQQAILKELAEIKKIVAASPRAPQAAAINVEGKVYSIGENPIKGSNTAKLTLLEFTDYQCPYCAKYARETYPQIEKEYVATGKLRYGLVDLPLDMHKQAFKAAEATRCAMDQGKYWEMHDRLFENQKALEPWTAHAAALGLDTAKFDECMSTGKQAPAVRTNLAVAGSVGVSATPGFLLAATDPADPKKVKGLMFIRGAQPFDTFKAEIDKALAKLQ